MTDGRTTGAARAFGGRQAPQQAGGADTGERAASGAFGRRLDGVVERRLGSGR